MQTIVKERPWPAYTHEVRAILDGRQRQFRRVVKTPSRVKDFYLNGPGKWTQSKTGEWHDVASEVMKDKDHDFYFLVSGDMGFDGPVPCPYGNPGDLLWVRETWTHNRVMPIEHRAPGDYIYRAQLCERGKTKYSASWKPSTTMPRAASRITLEVKRVWVERVQDIRSGDAMFEGVDQNTCPIIPLGNSASTVDYVAGFRILWDSINAPRGYSWDANPWVWCVEFKTVNP